MPSVPPRARPVRQGAGPEAGRTASFAPRTLRPGPFGGSLALPEAGADIWQLRISEYVAGMPDGSLGLLDATERERHAVFRKPIDRERYAAAHIALRHLLGAYLGHPPADVVLGREPCPLCPEPAESRESGGSHESAPSRKPHGRPCVPGADLHFSLSHSGDLVLLAFAPTPVGIDTELLTDVSQADEIVAALHPRERAELAALHADDTARLAAFGRCWCRKEAYLKGTGTGLAVPLDGTYVGAGTRPGEIPGWRLTDVEVGEGYSAAVAVAS
ncbi:4'-phosphopantetheinyl transferase family protein [Streptomyces sp. NPDC051561]|uniref:4'-phosphopantetheinyl transferase family protein n=1 Tax=Streptomyces sp. NPDC051561 TaxID=3365658 RepID=UPI003797AAA6